MAMHEQTFTQTHTFYYDTLNYTYKLKKTYTKKKSPTITCQMKKQVLDGEACWYINILFRVTVVQLKVI